MKTQFTMTIARIDNGFILVASSDAPRRSKLQADSPEKIQSLAKEVIDHMFDPVEKPTTKK